MKTKKLPIVSIAIMLAIFIACTDITERQVTALIRLKNICEITLGVDTVDIVMRFTDENGMPLVDADIYREHTLADSIMKLNLRLKETDNWTIITVKRKDGSPYCIGFCSDTLAQCLPSFITPLNPAYPIKDTIKLHVLCQCQ